MMYGLQEKLEDAINEYLVERGIEIEGETDELPDELNEIIDEFTSGIVESKLGTLKEDVLSDYIKEERKEREGFEKRLQEHWGEPLSLLEILIRSAIEVGNDFNQKYRAEAIASKDMKFEVLTRLHARACQVSSAILVLLTKGFADDAHARWRALHEIAVISSFIQQEDQVLAERYLLHEVVQQYKLASEIKKVHPRINVGPIPQEELDDLQSAYDSLLCRFGNRFKGEYGWASKALGVKNPTFRTIEKAASLDHLRPYYRMASANVHANSHGIKYRLGLVIDQNKVLLAGPSNGGLADPGHSTAISLNVATAALLATGSGLDMLVPIRVFGELENEIGEGFLEAHKEMEEVALSESESSGE